MSKSGSCSRCCFSFILTSGLAALFLWLSLRTSNPTCYIQNFYVPALTNSSNTSIYFDLKLDNKNKDMGIYYDALNITFHLGTNPGRLVGNRTVPSFYQGHKKHTRRKYVVEIYGGLTEVFNGSNPVFRVDLATKVRFKIVEFKTKRHKLVVRADVKLNSDGHKVEKKGIKLRSGAPQPKNRYIPHVLGLLLVIVHFFV